ncbi:hypothetical protein ACVWY9_002066 [Thermostichus sp. OS-CIW-31]
MGIVQLAHLQPLKAMNQQTAQILGMGRGSHPRCRKNAE